MLPLMPPAFSVISVFIKNINFVVAFSKIKRKVREMNPLKEFLDLTRKIDQDRGIHTPLQFKFGEHGGSLNSFGLHSLS